MIRSLNRKTNQSFWAFFRTTCTEPPYINSCVLSLITYWNNACRSGGVGRNFTSNETIVWKRCFCCKLYVWEETKYKV